MPKWGKIALYGAIIAVSVDYFLSPSLQKTLNLK